jgi:hypothetical protein
VPPQIGQTNKPIFAKNAGMTFQANFEPICPGEKIREPFGSFKRANRRFFVCQTKRF